MGVTEILIKIKKNQLTSKAIDTIKKYHWNKYPENFRCNLSINYKRYIIFHMNFSCIEIIKTSSSFKAS